MKDQQKFSIQKRAGSFSYAFNGLKILLREEHNSRIHFTCAMLAVLAGFFFEINALQWFALIASISFVFAMEILNTAMETLADFVSPGKHEAIRRIKDLSAAAVLISALNAFIAGLIIFLPEII